MNNWHRAAGGTCLTRALERVGTRMVWPPRSPRARSTAAREKPARLHRPHRAVWTLVWGATTISSSVHDQALACHPEPLGPCLSRAEQSAAGPVARDGRHMLPTPPRTADPRSPNVPLVPKPRSPFVSGPPFL